MVEVLRYGVLGAAAVCLAGLVVLIRATVRSGCRPIYAAPAGSALRGVFYAFGPGMAPWAKESASHHPLGYGAGIVYHLGAFAGLGYLALRAVAPAAVPDPLWLWRSLLAAGLAAGLLLLGKRFTEPAMRLLSVPDDYAANLLVDLFLALALATTWMPAAEPAFLAAGILLLLYIPVGKIRHCAYFFYSRALYGSQFGRRGTFPPGSGSNR